MKIGIIAEGSEDQIVIKNILRSFGIDGSDIELIKPALKYDQTDIHNPDNLTVGTLQGVKNACVGYNAYRVYFERFFADEDSKFIVIHVDTAEIDSQDFVFVKPIKTGNANYATELRKQVIELIDNWLANNYKNQILYAVAIEEIEAWCLAIYTETDTILSANPKKKLKEQIIPRLNIKYDFEEISKPFRKKKNIAKFQKYNQSLSDFVSSIKDKLSENV